MKPEYSQLGQKSAYISTYQPNLLFPIPRKAKRSEIGITDNLPFKGYDLWNAYEISWLNNKGKPQVATAVLIIPAESPYLIESKSLKLYFNSFNQTKFTHITMVENIIAADLSITLAAPVSVRLSPLEDINSLSGIKELGGKNIDDLDIEISDYSISNRQINTKDNHVSETINSHLLKSNCLVTGQPDWGSIEISYEGPKINHADLLKYLISFREHNEFHEQCVERIFMSLLNQCKPSMLSVYARYTRRGGIDINPFRTTETTFQIKNPRLVRQ